MNSFREHEWDDWLERPVFISGQMKSGGTLFHDMLDGNPEMFVYPDQPYFRLLFQREYKTQKHMIIDWLLGNRDLNMLLQPRIRLFQFDPTNEKTPIPFGYSDIPISSVELCGQIRGLENWEEVFSIEKYHQLLKEYLSAENLTKKDVILATVLAAANACIVDIGKNTWKRWAYRQAYTASTTIYSGVKRQNNEVEMFFKTFPKGQALFIVRNPHALVLSRRDHFQSRRSTNRWRGFTYFLSDAKVVRESLKELQQLERQYGKDKLKVVRYEDLVTNPRSTMIDICSFLRLSFSEIMLHPTAFGVPMKVITAHGFDGKKVNKTRAERWKKELSGFRILLIDAMLTDGFGFHGSRWGYTLQTPSLLVIMAKLFLILPISSVLRFYALVRKTVSHLRDFLFDVFSLHYLKGVQLHVYHADTKKNIAVTRDLYSEPNKSFILGQLSEIIRKKSLSGYQRVLDVGCRHGLWTFAFAQCSGTVVGIEPIPEFVDIVNQQIKRLRVDNIEVIQDTLEAYEPEEKFDLIHVRSVLHNNPIDRNQKVQKLIGMLAPDGRLYISYFAAGQIISRIIEQLRRRNWHGFLAAIKGGIATIIFRNILRRKDYPFAFLTKRGFKNFLESNGLEIEYLGYLDSCIDGSYSERFGPFIREFDALCKRKKMQTGRGNS